VARSAAAKALTVDAVTLKAQADASDPRASAWVSANAGSGKTYVLARRVVRLLLAGADPGHILCLTFTAPPPPRWRSASSTRSRNGRASTTRRFRRSSPSSKGPVPMPPR
jgi:hypothetical protein